MTMSELIQRYSTFYQIFIVILFRVFAFSLLFALSLLLCLSLFSFTLSRSLSLCLSLSSFIFILYFLSISFSLLPPSFPFHSSQASFTSSLKHYFHYFQLNFAPLKFDFIYIFIILTDNNKQKQKFMHLFPFGKLKRKRWHRHFNCSFCAVTSSIPPLLKLLMGARSYESSCCTNEQFDVQGSKGSLPWWNMCVYVIEWFF